MDDKYSSSPLSSPRNNIGKIIRIPKPSMPMYHQAPSRYEKQKFLIVEKQSLRFPDKLNPYSKSQRLSFVERDMDLPENTKYMNSQSQDALIFFQPKESLSSLSLIDQSQHSDIGEQSNLQKFQTIPQHFLKVETLTQQQKIPIAKSFIENCLGLVKDKNTILDRDFIGNAFLISSRLLLTSSKDISSYRNNKLVFYSFSNRQQYEIQEFHHHEVTLGNEGKYYCLLKLKQPIQLKQYLALGVAFQPDFSNAEIIGLDLIHPIFFQTNKHKIGYYSQNQDKNTIYYSTNLEEIQNGSAIICEKNKSPFVVGIHSKNSSRQRKDNSVGNIVDQQFITSLCKWLTQSERQSIQIYVFDQDKFYTLAQFSVLLDIESEINPSWRKFDKGNFIKKSQQAFAQRMGGYIDFQISNRFIEYITVNDIRLYFQLYHQQKVYTIMDLNDQYYKIKKVNLILSIRDIKLSVNIPLKEIVKDKRNKTMFEKLLNLLQAGKFEIKSFPKWFLEELQTLKSTQFYINLPRRQHKVQIIVRKKKILVERFDFSIDENTTIQHVINYLQTKKYNVMNTEIFCNGFGRLNQKDYTQVILHLKFKQLIFRIFDNESFISPQSKIQVDKFKNKQIQMGKLLHNYGQMKILSYQQKNNSFTFQKVNKILVNEDSNTTYKIKYKFSEVVQTLQCSANTLVKLSNQKWAKVKDLQLGQIMLGVHHKCNDIVEYELIQRSITYENHPRELYCLDVANTHTFIANNLIIHNVNPFSIKVVQKRGNKNIEYTKDVYRHQLIKDVFDGFKVYISKTLLNKELTFGDYQIQKCKCLFITPSSDFQREINMEQPCFMVTKWNQCCKPYHQYTLEQKSKWKEHYIGIFSNQLFHLDDDLFVSLQRDNNAHLIVEQKKNFKRLNYYKNVQKYLRNERQTLRIYSDQRENKVFKEKANRQAQFKVEDIFPIFLYTTNCFYKQLNSILREVDIIPKKQWKNEHFLCLSSIITRSLKMLPSLEEQTLVYRGIKNNNFDFTIGPDRIILFQSFTSTSKKIEKARNFAQDNGILFKIKTISGKDISKYSLLDDEAEVLISPFTYFYFEGQEREYGIRVIKLRQICLPSSGSRNLTFWVDDRPQNNWPIIRQIQNNTQVIQISSTAIMKLVVREFFWIYTLFGRKIIIITDMVRRQDDRENRGAGIDLLQLITDEMGLSNGGFIFTSSIGRTERAISMAQINLDRWTIVSIPGQMVRLINYQIAGNRQERQMIQLI